MNLRQIQCLLAFLGRYRGPIDGLAGPKTRQAVTDFQRAAGLVPDGRAGPATQAAMARAVARWESRPPGFWEDIQHFTRQEFACKCGQYCDGFPAEPEEKLLRLAERVREHFGKPMTVTSGVRCPRHNANVGGVANSRHLKGKAMDFVVSGVPASSVLPYVQSLSGVRYAYAINSSAVHMDVD